MYLVLFRKLIPDLGWLFCSVEVLFDTCQVKNHNAMLCLKCTFSLLKKYQKNKAVAALPKTGFHSAGWLNSHGLLKASPVSVLLKQ